MTDSPFKTTMKIIDDKAVNHPSDSLTLCLDCKSQRVSQILDVFITSVSLFSFSTCHQNQLLSRVDHPELPRVHVNPTLLGSASGSTHTGRRSWAGWGWEGGGESGEGTSEAGVSSQEWEGGGGVGVLR